jgi:hypothetical protein
MISHVFFHVCALLMCSVYSILFNWDFFIYNIIISFFILKVRVCVSIRFAASEYFDVFMFILAYFGVILCIKHDLLKYIFALQVSNVPLIFLYLFMLYARLAFTILNQHSKEWYTNTLRRVVLFYWFQVCP